MQIDVMNGTNRINHMNGTNRISHINGGATVAELMEMQGTNRIEYMNGYTLNGYTLNGYTLNALEDMDEADYEVLKMLVAGELGESEEMQGLSLAAIAGLAKKVVGGVKKVVGGVKKGVEKVKGFVQKVKGASTRAEEVIETAQSAPDGRGMERLDAFQSAVVDEAAAPGDERGLFGPPSLLKEPGKWFASKKVPTIQKVAVVAGAVVLVDALTGGNIILKRAGIMKGKKKRR